MARPLRVPLERGDAPATSAGPGSVLVDYLRPLRFDHWIKNLVVPVGSALALVAEGSRWRGSTAVAVVLAFGLSGGISSVNYAINEILDAPFDARHPTKRHRPIPSGRVRTGPLLGLVAGLLVATAAIAVMRFPLSFSLWCLALLSAGLVYNLPPLRLKDWPFLDSVVESVTNPIRLAIGWTAVASAMGPPPALGVAVWAFGAFLMTGKRLAELRLLGPLAVEYRPTFAAYTVRRLLVVQVAYGLAGLGALGRLFVSSRPGLLPTLPLIAGLLAWALRMTFEPQSPLVDPEHLYRRPGFLAVALSVFALLLVLAAR